MNPRCSRSISSSCLLRSPLSNTVKVLSVIDTRAILHALTFDSSSTWICSEIVSCLLATETTLLSRITQNYILNDDKNIFFVYDALLSSLWLITKFVLEELRLRVSQAELDKLPFRGICLFVRFSTMLHNDANIFQFLFP